MEEFRKILQQVDRSYDDFVSGVISYVKIPGNEAKIEQITNFILLNPTADSSDVLEYMIKHTGFNKDANYSMLEAVI